MAAFTYTKPTVGGSEDTWGTTLNANWDALGTFLGALDSTELAVLDGITATTAELNILDGVTVALADITATAAELNKLDGVTVTTAEINYLDGVTSAIQTQIDSISQPPELTQVQVEDDTSTVFGQVSGQRLAQAAAANVDYAAGIVALSPGSIGSFCLAANFSGSAKGFGDTVSGSSLRPTSAEATPLGAALSGTWMCLGESNDGSGNRNDTTLWLRIS